MRDTLAVTKKKILPEEGDLLSKLGYRKCVCF